MNSPATPTLPWPAEDFSSYGPVDARPVGKIQAYVERIMHRNWVSIPHVTHHDDADVTEFEQHRKAWNAAHPTDKRTLLPTNIVALDVFRKEVTSRWFKSLRRRGQRRRLNWIRMDRLARQWLPRARIVHPWPQQRFAVRTRDKSPVR